MRLNTLTMLMVLVLLLSFTFVALAGHKQSTIESNQFTFDAKSRTYQPKSSIPYLSMPIEQKYMAIKSINAFEDHLETNGLNQ